MADALSDNVERILAEQYFADVEEVKRPFSVFGSFNDEMMFAIGHDGTRAENICGYEKIELDNIYNKYIQRHFDCSWNVARDPLLQLAMRAVNGIDITSWSAEYKKRAEDAVACGYLYKERNRIYTKILVADIADSGRMFDISRQLEKGVFEEEAAFVAERMAALLKDTLLEFLIPEWRLANKIASISMLNAIINELVEQGVLVPPQNGIGAEGCWMCVKKEAPSYEKKE